MKFLTTDEVASRLGTTTANVDRWNSESKLIPDGTFEWFAIEEYDYLYGEDKVEDFARELAVARQTKKAVKTR